MTNTIQVQPELSPKKHPGVIVAVVTIMLTLLGGAFYLTFNSDNDSTPPSLTPEKSTLQGFIKDNSNNLGFIKVENNDLKTPSSDVDKLNLSFNQNKNLGLYYLYTDSNSSYESVLKNLSKEATVFMANYNPPTGKWFTTPHTYFKKDQTMEIAKADLKNQPIKPGQGFVFMTASDLTMYDVKDGNQFADNDYEICKNGVQGWNLFAAHTNNLNSILQSCTESLESVWIQKTIDTIDPKKTFNQVNLDDIKTAPPLSHSLIWVKFKEKPVVNESINTFKISQTELASGVTVKPNDKDTKYAAYEIEATKDTLIKEITINRGAAGDIEDFSEIEIVIAGKGLGGLTGWEGTVATATNPNSDTIKFTLNKNIALNANDKISLYIYGDTSADAVNGHKNQFGLVGLKVVSSQIESTYQYTNLYGKEITVKADTPSVATVTLDGSQPTKLEVTAGQKDVKALTLKLTSEVNLKIKELSFHVDGKKQLENIEIRSKGAVIGTPTVDANGDFKIDPQTVIAQGITTSFEILADVKIDSKDGDTNLIELKSITFVDETGTEIKKSYDLAGPILVTKNPAQPVVITAGAATDLAAKEVKAGDKDVKIASFNFSSTPDAKIKEFNFKIEGTGSDNLENIEAKLNGNSVTVSSVVKNKFKIAFQTGNEFPLTSTNSKIEIYADIKATALENTGQIIELTSIKTADDKEFNFEVVSPIVSISKQNPTQVTLSLDKQWTDGTPPIIEANPDEINVEYAKLTIKTDVPFKMNKLKFLVKTDADKSANDDVEVFKNITLFDGSKAYISSGSEFNFGEGIEINGEKTFTIKVDIKVTAAEYKALNDTLYSMIVFTENPIVADKKINSIEDIGGPLLKLMPLPADLLNPPEEE